MLLSLLQRPVFLSFEPLQVASIFTSILITNICSASLLFEVSDCFESFTFVSDFVRFQPSMDRATTLPSSAPDASPSLCYLTGILKTSRTFILVLPLVASVISELWHVLQNSTSTGVYGDTGHHVASQSRMTERWVTTSAVVMENIVDVGHHAFGEL